MVCDKCREREAFAENVVIGSLMLGSVCEQCANKFVAPFLNAFGEELKAASLDLSAEEVIRIHFETMKATKDLPPGSSLDDFIRRWRKEDTSE